MTMMISPFEEVIQKIKDAQIITEPYPHLMIDNIFPDEFYDEILKKIPSLDDYALKSKYPGRKTLTLDSLDNLDEDKKIFWEQMTTWLRSDEFANILLKKFSIDKKGHSDFFLHKDLEDFEVKPHTDLRSKLVTYLFYLPKDASMPNLGTDVLIPKKDANVSMTTEHQEWENFDIVKSSKYVPNSFFCFTPSENSFHAVKIKFPENCERKERDTIRGFVFDKTNDDYPEYLFGK
jgi:hypothetical protein